MQPPDRTCDECGANTRRGRLYVCSRCTDARFCTYDCALAHDDRDWEGVQLRGEAA